MSDVNVNYSFGTDRIVTPEVTLERISPLLKQCGISRCADVTWLDNIGIPVYCAVRPNASFLQLSNGKGLTESAAKVSALMEAIEVFHAENPSKSAITQYSLNELKSSGKNILTSNDLTYQQGIKHFPDMKVEWVRGIELFSQEEVWAPSSLVYFGRQQSFIQTGTNGLASGNHAIEALLHSLYELIERDAISSLSQSGRLNISDLCQILDLKSLPNGELTKLFEHINASGSKLVVLACPSVIKTPTFWAVLLNPETSINATAFNVGFGCHVDPEIALCRAITEAAQSRASIIQGAREDILIKPVWEEKKSPQSSKAYQFFDKLKVDTSWSDISINCSPKFINLQENYAHVLSALSAQGHNKIYKFDLTRDDLNIPVVKLVCPTLRFNSKFF
ncbi:YcaO-like family protein [Catenovulum sediminis]|uniref:YcaO-like family protein n=1 Tax=Catenovulum sediminis TaxID=1740262 RepID=A0ABV1RI75_9ALTE